MPQTYRNISLSHLKGIPAAKANKIFNIHFTPYFNLKQNPGA